MKRIRRTFFWLHLIAGVTAGLIILAMSATGVLLAFERQILDATDVPATGGPQGQTRLGLEELVGKAGSAAKPGAALTGLTLSSDPNTPVMAAFGREAPLYLDPCTGKTMEGAAPGTRQFMRVVTDLHRWLAFPGGSNSAGRAITGAANLAFVFLVLSGLVIWMPKRWSWRALRPQLWFQREMSGRVRLWNWHNVLGFWSSVPMLVIILCGAVISYPWAGDLLYRLAGESPPPRPAARSAPANSPVSGRERAVDSPAVASGLNAALAKVEALSPDWQTIQLRLPAGKESVFTVLEGHRGRPDLRSTLTIDTASSVVLKTDNSATRSLGQKLRLWARWLHTGEAGGVAGQALAALVSAAACVLVVTGLLLAGRRLRNRFNSNPLPPP